MKEEPLLMGNPLPSRLRVHRWTWNTWRNPVSQPTIKSSRSARDSDVVMSATFIGLLVIQAAFGVSYSAFLLLPKFLNNQLHASAAEIGWVTGIALVGGAIASPFIGFFARVFDRRFLLVMALVLQGGASLGFVFVMEIGPLAYLLRIAQGVAFVLVFNCATTIAADLLDRKHLARGVGYLGVAMMLTNALAPLVVEPIVESFDWPTAFITSGALALLPLFAVLLFKDPKPKKSIGTSDRIDHGPLRPIYYASLLMGAGLGAMFTFVQPFALEQGAERVGQFFLGYVATAVGIRTVLGRLTDRVGPTKVSVAGLAFYALVLFATAGMKVDFLIPLGACLGIAHGFLYPALSAAGLFMTSGEQRPVFMGWFACAYNAGFAVTVLVLGPVADRYGYPTLFLSVGTLISTGVPSLLQMHQRVVLAGARNSP
jgi:predicted MFS family arabinose efflux permease